MLTLIYQTALSTSKYYGVLSTEHKSFLLKLRRDRGKVDIDDSFKDEAKELPPWPDAKKPPSPEVYQTYKEFFEDWGTYVVRSIAFGARYQLKLETQMSSMSSKKDFEAHISAEYNGICSVKGSTGGDPGKAADLGSDPDKPDKLDAWEQSISNATARPISVKVISLGDIIKECQDLDVPERKAVANKLNNALAYFNSFKIVQGYLYTEIRSINTIEYQLSIGGLPGIEIYGSPVSTTIQKRTVSNAGPTLLKVHSKFVGFTNVKKLPTEICTPRLADIRLFAPDPAFFKPTSQINVEVLVPGYDTFRLRVTNGPVVEVQWSAKKWEEKSKKFACLIQSLLEPKEYQAEARDDGDQ
ncbi:hypothetical protein BDV38DRAFT_289446 [Aspergillus pseudotamarii]|uniref:MACPF domain-containing protein n=1 Tax=Aspergillus pseudotamarii TaxID=132259 RepID=A0A5N6S7K6_ASPPS|nr:uncharacterized protein BDV38DRAFT_289446 [Aspergillus pseudotamarii]KAE8130656.1 hypothetical protein BDV38DRAFT_289446 [Aspergillus pseudotamarii]